MRALARCLLLFLCGCHASLAPAPSEAPAARPALRPKLSDGCLAAPAEVRAERAAQHALQSSTGAYSREELESAFAPRANDVRACYETALARDPKLAGRVALEWLIAEDGSVPLARVEQADRGLHDVGCCVARFVRSWTFALASGNGRLHVRKAFQFTPLPPVAAEPELPRPGRIQALPAADYEELLGRTRAELVSCYDRLLRGPGARHHRARIELRPVVTVDAGGQPKRISFEDDGPSRLTDCVRPLLARSRYPAGVEDARYEVPLAFDH